MENRDNKGRFLKGHKGFKGKYVRGDSKKEKELRVYMEKLLVNKLMFKKVEEELMSLEGKEFLDWFIRLSHLRFPQLKPIESFTTEQAKEIDGEGEEAKDRNLNIQIVSRDFSINGEKKSKEVEG